MRRRLQFIREMRTHWLYRLAAGVWLILTVVSTFVTYGPPEWQQRVSAVRYLPRWPWYIWAIGFLSVGLVFVFEAAFKLHSNAAAPPAQSNSSGTTTADSAALSNDPPPARTSSVTTPDNQSKSQKRKPRLEVVSAGFNYVACIGLRQIWASVPQEQIGNHGGFGLMAMVRNCPAPAGEATGTAGNTAVSLDFFDGQNRRVGSIARGYWFGHSENEIQIVSGEQYAILVGIYRGETIEIYNNPHTTGVHVPHRAGALRNWSPPSLRRATVAFDEVIDIIITIVDTETGSTHLRKKVRFRNAPSEHKLESAVLD